MSELTDLNKEIENCQLCDLAKCRNKVVPGMGAEDADILFIGEAPGRNEDLQGVPFVGQAGHFLDHLLASINLSRQQVFIANVIKCRPPENRDPLPIEMQSCRNWLKRQIDIINPKIIVTLGRFSMVEFFPGKTISKVHGIAQRQDGVVYYPMYHPAAALHQQKFRQAIEADMLKIPSLMEEIKKVPDTESKPQQLSMFED